MSDRALIVGINDYARPDGLRGCVADALAWRAFLLARGWSGDAITMLLNHDATAAAIRHALEQMVGGSAPGDRLVFCFSGHGAQHNIGDALDITRDEQHGPPLDKLAVILLRDPRAWYTIFEAQIRNNQIQAGSARAYMGPNPHNHHMHLSILHDRREDTTPWDLSGLDDEGSFNPAQVAAASASDEGEDEDDGGGTAALVASALILAAGVWLGLRSLRTPVPVTA